MYDHEIMIKIFKFNFDLNRKPDSRSKHDGNRDGDEKKYEMINRDDSHSMIRRRPPLPSLHKIHNS
jgi:hypothetical protein